jgi:cell division protein ZapA
MSQSVVTIRLNGHPYQIGCGAGEEDHVANLGAEVESIMQSLVGSVGQIGEARLLAMVALILADRASTAVAANGASNAAAPAARQQAHQPMMRAPPRIGPRRFWKMQRQRLPR